MRCHALINSCLVFLFSLLLFLGTAGAAASPGDAEEAPPRARWSVGDRPNWAQPDFDDSNWAPANELPAGSSMPDGVFWIRDHFTIGEDFLPPANSVLNITGAGAFEIYFDGHLLGSSGIVGNAIRDEKPGALQFNLGAPRAFLTPGDHVLAVRASAHHLRDPSQFFVIYRLQSADDVFNRNSLNLVMLGAALAAVSIIAVFFTFSSSGARQRWIFATTLIVAGGVAVITAIETGELAGVAPYTWRTTTDFAASVAALSIFVALPSLLLMRLVVPHRKFWIAGLAIVFLVALPPWGGLSYEHDTRSFISLCLYCLAICASAPPNLRRRAVFFAGGIGAGLVAILLDPEFLFAFLISLALLLALSFALDIRARELSVKQAQLTAARLEAEMLKRNIQPHFLMNSLTAITEWIETAPMDALRFVHGLADEFRSLSNLSGKKLVSLSDEIDLCRTHLALMGMRHKKNFQLDTKGLDGDETIPPGIFHTLIENALSHNRYRDTTIIFELKKMADDKETTYLMTAPLGRATGHRDYSTGAGLKYIKSRLEESYADQWRLTSEPKDGHWVTEIRLKRS